MRRQLGVGATLLCMMAAVQADPAPNHATAAASAEPASRCTFGAFVNETDRNGLNVRQAPSVKARILGTLPPVRMTAELGSFRIKAEVEVLGSSDGWFLVRGGRDNTVLTNLPPRPAFSGTGWVSGSKLTVKSQATQGLATPNAGAAVAVRMEDGSSFDSDGVVDASRLVACSGQWALVEMRLDDLPEDLRRQVQASQVATEGLPAGRIRAWFNALCALQETSCSGLGEPPRTR